MGIIVFVALSSQSVRALSSIRFFAFSALCVAKGGRVGSKFDPCTVVGV